MRRPRPGRPRSGPRLPARPRGPAAPEETGGWRSYWLAADERAGCPVRIGAVAEQPDAWLSAIANGYGVALAPASAARFHARPGVTYRPVRSVSPSRVGVAWAAADDANPVVREFVRCCREAGPDASAA